jgi:SagB-type dehydrogenase family enzyme
MKNPPFFITSAASRRDFLKAAALAGGALTLAGCSGGAPPAAADTLEQTAPPSGTTDTAADSPPAEYLPPIDGSFDSVPLPAPKKSGGLPLMEALALRESRRSYAKGEIPLQTLSDLLWAAFGINRPSKGLRTAPSAVNAQDVDIYLATAKGLFLYRPGEHALQAVLAGDLRPLTATQSFAAQAPVNLVYVSDYRKLESLSSGEYGEVTLAWSWINTGFISQNVYLFCASEGLGTVVRAWVDRSELEDAMGLEDGKHITMAQSVGYPG